MRAKPSDFNRLMTFCMGILATFLFLEVQGQIPNNSWRDHIAYNKALSVAYAGNKVFCASIGGLFYYDLEDYTINTLSKVQGLSDTDLSKIAYDSESNTLIITYKNGNIDLLKENDIINLSDIKRKSIIGEKNVNSITLHNNLAYLATGFGIVVLDYEREEFKDTYYLGSGGANQKINDVAFFDNTIYASTDEGVFKADATHPLLVDFNNWELISNLPSPQGKYKSMASGSSNLYIVYSNEESGNDVVYRSESTGWEYWPGNIPQKIEDLKIHNNVVYAVVYGRVYLYDNNTGENYSRWTNIPQEVDIASENEFWIADENIGLVGYSDGQRIDLIPDGPKENEVFHMSVFQNRLFAGRGGRTNSLNNAWVGATFSVFEEEKWKSFRLSEARDFTHIAADPFDPNHIYVASWGYGVYEYQNYALIDSFNHLNTETHPLRSLIPGSAFIRIGSIKFDDKGTLWVVNAGVENSIHALTRDGTWYSFDYGPEMDNVHQTELIITEYGQKWVVMPKGGGLFVFDNGADLEDLNDDRSKRLSIIDSEGNTLNDVYSIAEDKNGDIWVGTSEGPVVYYSPERVFDENIAAQRPLVPFNDEDNTAGFLLESQIITDIEIDGANRKWLSTSGSGVFLMSEDGTNEIKHFTTDNSPLLSDNINDVKVHPATGEVFIASNKGLVSFMGQATEGGDDFRNVYVYPNPIREDYSGDITITGLIADAQVKITDVAGNIVYETTTLGGQAIWNGNNFDGEKVHTGVYLVFCTNNDGSKTFVTKMLFIH